MSEWLLVGYLGYESPALRKDVGRAGGSSKSKEGLAAMRYARDTCVARAVTCGPESYSS